MDQITKSFLASMESIKKNIDENKNIEGIHKYIIYFSLLDVLGKYAFPNKKHNERYKKLLQCFSCWKYKKYISSLQLECKLDQINKNLAVVIRKKINMNPLTHDHFFNKIVDSDEVDFTEDKLKEGLTELELGIYNKNISAIHEARYDNLFYKLRCFVIHEYRLPTPNALNLDENSLVPIYYCFNNQYRLWFSPKIISLILDECIEKIKVLNIHSYEDVFEFVPKCWI
ncbi:hypothetical protein A2V47_00355 [Candidatus Atribacteria bacterium RBG_19FT_COMBO_35_14]|uniref:Uncharacterized protein n=1 Tax=Candidatus Sediminicultor quintus TaxID=1797291 RepID=A0A1F5AFU7_9BACT|nr:MAG: hypothetical protein A2V47_00355 [Candidatus Atribacteria bacterium RBG_19FT_COMBO_35_14]